MITTSVSSSVSSACSFCSVLGGMKSVTWTQVAQYIILIVSYLVPVVYLSYQLFAIPVPELTYGRVLQTNNAKAIEITRDAKEKETRALWKKDADDANAKIKMGNLNDTEVDKLRAAAKTATQQATAPAASDDAKIGRYLTVPSGVGMWNFLALTFCLMVGTAGLPHILTRYYTTPSVREARTSVAWSLFFIFLLYFTAPAYAAFARFVIYAKLVGTQIADLPRWITLWQPAGLFDVIDKNGDGIVQWADFVVKSTDFVVLSMPEVAGLPFVITGLVMAGGLAAALSTADGLLLTIANAFSHDLYYNVIDPTASLTKRLTITKILLVVTALVAAWVATFRIAIIVELVAWAFSLAGASFFPALVMGIWWKRANKTGACVGMIAGLAVTAYYMIGSRFYGVSWFGTQTIASAAFGLPVGFITIWIVSLMTEAPPLAGAGSCRQRALSEKRSSSYGRSAGAHLAGWRALIYFRSWKDAEKNLFSSFQAHAIDRSALSNSACGPLPMFHGDFLFGAPQDRRSSEQQTKQQIALVL